MSDKTGFSVAVTVNPASGFKPLPDLVAFDLCKAYPATDGNLLLHNTRTGKRAMVMPQVHAVLLRCHQFRTLDQHIASIIDENPDMDGQQADMRKVLQTMLDSGIMVSAKKTCDALQREANKQTADKDDSAPVVVIITWERPQALERLLKSFASNCETKNIHRLYVVDDSRGAENIELNRALTAKFAYKLKIPLQYFGRVEQLSLLNNLSARLPQHKDAIHFLADQSRWRNHWTSGLARNLALLLSCGHRLVMVDDDTLCDVYDPDRPGPDISFSDKARDAEFFSSEKDWSPHRQALNPDPVARHMQCLGLTFSQALSKLGSANLKPSGLADANALLVSELGPESPVLVTECGSLGCPGTSKNTWLPDMSPSSLKRMLSSKRSTQNALNKRMLWSGRRQPHFSPRPNMSQITGLDNRQMLPPYLPVLRGEDRLFGNMLDFVFPGAICLDYPWAVPHLPMPQREWLKEDRDFTPGASFPTFFFERVLEFKSSCQATLPSERLTALSGWFADLAASSEDSLLGMYRDSLLNDTAEQLQNLDTLLKNGEATPQEWQDYLKNGIRQLTDGLDLVSREDFIIKGLPEKMVGTELVTFWKETWTGFAAALTAWPEIRQVATEFVELTGNPDRPAPAIR